MEITDLAGLSEKGRNVWGHLPVKPYGQTFALNLRPLRTCLEDLIFKFTLYPFACFAIFFPIHAPNIMHIYMH